MSKASEGGVESSWVLPFFSDLGDFRWNGLAFEDMIVWNWAKLLVLT